MQVEVRWIAAAATLCLVAAPVAAQIEEVPYGTVGPNIADFGDVAGAGFPGQLYDEVLVSGGCSFGEHFAGQTVTFEGDFDVLSGTPSSPLTVVAGEEGQNLAVSTDSGQNELFPYGPAGYPEADGFGEGSVAILLPGPVATFGLRIAFWDDQPTHFRFFRSDGSLIAALDVIGQGYFGFRRVGDTRDIAGVSIDNIDTGGLGFDDLFFGEFDDTPVVVTSWSALKGK